MPVILVGRRAGQRERDRNWRLVAERWATLGWPIYEGFHQASEGPFSMAAASNRAAATGDWDVALYVGGDFVLTNVDRQATGAVDAAVATGQLTFAHTHLTLLDMAETLRFERTGELAGAGTRHPNTFSGALAITRELWDEVGGFDERFRGWGWEDLAFWASCCALGGGYGRVDGDMYHLWHPRSRDENEGNPDHGPNQVLGQRYLAAKGNRRAMLAILAERP